MESTSCSERAARLLDYCLRGVPWPRALVRELAADECSDALFRVVAEGLADRFEPALCDTYAALFAEVIDETNSAALVERYRRIRVPRPVEGRPRSVFVLSRVTLGADVAVTSVILDGAKRRFPDSRIYLVGPRKNWELFAADPRILHLPIAYRRGTLRDRLASWPELKKALAQPDCIVIDPDSRLTQLGLLPVCPDESYYFFESRGYGGTAGDSLVELTREWVERTFGIPDAAPFIAPVPAEVSPGITVSLGVGDNPAKRLSDPFEEELLKILAETGAPLWIDLGAGGEETSRVERAIARSGVNARTWQGSFAGFAALIARSRLYVGYDSAGQHAAAACRTPLITVFAGFPCPRMFARWRPTGPGRIDVIKAEERDPGPILERVSRAISR